MFSRLFRRMLVPMAAAAVTAAAEGAPAIPEGFFPFPMQWDDASAGTATDLSWLNAKPAGADGPVTVRDGRFVDGTGRRVRFFGVGIGGDAALMSHDEAKKMAAHLAKFGVNAVRFHNLDGRNPDHSLIDFTRPGTRNLSPEQLDKLDFLIAELKKNGIYINMNLRVMRELKPEDGVPEYPRAPYPMKQIDRFSPRWIELQKEYATQLLAHVNPYTGMRLADDPALITVEINNENSILKEGPGFHQRIPDSYRRELQRLWNDWLAKRYADDAALREAWSRSTGELGPDLIQPGHVWTKEQHNVARISMLNTDAPDRPRPNADFRVDQSSPQDWHLQVHLAGLDLRAGHPYTVSFRMRSEKPRTVRLSATIDRAPWHNLGLDAVFPAGPEWKEHTFGFTPKNPVPKHTRLAFSVGTAAGTFSIDGVRLREGNTPPEFPEGASLATGNLPLFDSGTPVQSADWLAFLIDLDRIYADDMRAFLRDKLKVTAPVIDSQIDYGGLTGLNREAAMDFTDRHAYWQHPEFLAREWDWTMGNWRIGNTPQIAAVADGSASALFELAASRVAGKPFCISEYDHPYPNDYASEMMPGIALAGLRQDWDAVYTFVHGNYGSRADARKITTIFDQTNHPGKFGFFPAAALAFRRGSFAPAPKLLRMALPAKPWEFANRAENLWTEHLDGGRRPDLFNTRMELLAPDAKVATPAISVSGTPEAASPVTLTRDDSGTLLTAGAPDAEFLIGHFGGKRRASARMELESAAFPGNFGAVAWNSIDGKPLEQSERSLFTIGGRFENSNLEWNAERNCIGRKWGDAPVLGTALDSRVTLSADAPRRVFALDSTGARRTPVKSEWSDGKLRFRVEPAHQALWYEIVR